MSEKKRRTVEEVIKNANNIAFYGRVSTKEQNTESQQVGAVEALLNKYNKEVMKEMYTEETSAYSKPYKKRQKLMELLTSVESKEIDAIIVSDRDRLSRQTEEHFELRSLFDQLGIPVIIASQNELYDKEDIIRNIVEDALTKMESDNISTRTKATLNSLVAQELYIGGHPPYGYDLLSRRLSEGRKEKVIAFKAKDGEFENIRDIFYLYRKGETTTSIANHLKKKDTEGKWTSTKVRSIILNPIYTGYLFYNRYIYEGKKRSFRPVNEWISYPFPLDIDPIISIEEWWYCWQKHQQLKDKPPRHMNTSFYFNGLITCYCDNTTFLIGKDQRTNVNKSKGKCYGYCYYICPNCREKILADELHFQFFELLYGLKHPDDLIMQEVTEKLGKEMALKQGELKRLKIKQEMEENNLSLLKGFEQEVNSSELFIQESENFEALAYYISKSDSLNKIKAYRTEIKRLSDDLKKLKEVEEDNQILKDMLKSFFLSHNWARLTHPVLRSLVLFTVKECSLAATRTISLKVHGLPPNYLHVKSYVK
ncbi:recombinase family protein [Bacillus sp. 1P06AnD]|uniref:recombinase family protein n=1 Tax=Bacillus sp. 1P06AnD TaxID=3132208 RepID=UPI0039A2A943